MILFSDFDKTLFFRDNDEQTMANIKAIEKWRDAGNLFCITTGRSFRSVTEQMPQIKHLCDYYIVDSGSIVLSHNEEMMDAFFFDQKTVDDITNFSKYLPEIPILVYYTPDSEGLEYKTNRITKLRLWFKDVSLLHDVNSKIVDKFNVFSVYNNDLRIRPSCSELDGYHGFVEIIPLNSGKSNAIKALAKKAGVSPQDIITIGDGLNDLGMVKDFGGYAINNSELSNAEAEINTISSLESLIDSKLADTAML